MAYRLGGRPSLPYLGVEAATPADTVRNRRSPTVNDFQNFNIGTWWLKTNAQNEAEELWILISLVGSVATWVQLYPSNAGGASEFVEDVGIANELAGVINVIGGAGAGGFININTVGSGNTVSIKLNNTIQWPDSDPTQSQGAIYLGGDRFMHNLGTDSTFLGSLAGPLNDSSTGNTGIGSASLNAITATSAANTALGAFSGFNLTNGIKNLLLGVNAGTNYTSEDNNIALLNNGTVADSGAIRIGNPVDHNDCYIAGIYNKSIGTTNAPVFIDNTGKLGTSVSVSLVGSSFFAVVAPGGEQLNAGVGVYSIGAQDAMSVVYDNFGTFSPGDGAGTGASFTAPADGYYSLTFTGIAYSPVGNNCNFILTIVHNASVYYSCQANARLGVLMGNAGNITNTITIHLNAADVVTFTVDISAATFPVDILGGSGSSVFPYITSISGSFLKEL